MREFAQAARSPGKVYFTGGATALLLGFRETTIDLDIKLDPEPKGAFEAIATLKNQLDLNLELASPDDFIPVPSDWRERSQPIAAIGSVEFFHYDFAMQALAKIERGFPHDLDDAARLVRGGYTTITELKTRFSQIEPDLLRYPSIDAGELNRKLNEFLAHLE